MNVENLIKSDKVEVSPLNEDILFEQLALKKLKELQRLSHQDRFHRHFVKGKYYLKLLFSAFRRVELVRQVGPGLRPLEEHEWKLSRRTDSIR